MRYPRTLPWMLLPLAACTGEVKETEPVMSEVDGGSPQSISVTSTVGVGTVDVPILMRNEFGAASGGGSVTVAVSGTYTALAASTLSFDDGGYAFASVTSSAPSKFTVSVTGATDDVTTGAEEASYAVYGDLPGLQIDRGTWLPEDARGPDTVVAGTDGVIAATTRTVWWVPGDPGVPAHMVAELPFAIGGMEGADLDGDGLRDVIIWGGSYVVALRGREGGGMSWGGAWSPDSGDVVGAAAADLDGDRLTDIAVGITNDITSNVQILTGDGAWTFEPTAVLELNYAIESIAATDDGRDGRADVIVLSGLTGWLRRYTWSEDGWVGGSPPELDAYTAASGARLLPHMDLDDDGVTDVLLVGAPGSSQDFVYYTMNPDEITLYEIDFPSVNPAVTDITGDGVPEMLVLSSENLSVISYQGEDASSRFRRSKMSIGEREGPIGAVDLNGDGAAEVAVATTHLDWFQGELDEGTWGTTSWGWRSYAAKLSGPHLFTDIDGDGATDIISLTDESGTPALKLLYFVLDSGEVKLSVGDSVDLTGTDVESLAVCDDVAWAVTSTGTSRTLQRVRITSEGDLELADETASVSGSEVACGELPSGSVAVAATSGSWVSYSYSAGTGFTTASSGDVGAAYAASAADTDGDGFVEVVGCDASDCSIVVADLDGDGDDEVIVGGNSLTITGLDEDFEHDASGVVSVSDADGDGLPDVLVTDDEAGKILVFRSVDGGVAPPIVLHTTREIYGPAALADVDADGLPEVVVQGTDGAVIHSAATE